MDFKEAKRNKKIDIWVSIILLISLLLCVNFLISNIKLNLDITKDSRYSLSPETISRLSKIITPVDIVITIPENNELPKIVQKLILDFNLLFTSFENAKSKYPIRIHRINIDTAIPSSELIQRYQITERNQIIIMTPTGAKKVIYKYRDVDGTNVLDSSNIFRSKDSLARESIWESGFYKNWKETNNGILEPSEFRGEQIILNSILDVAARKEKRNTAYFTRGHGEGSPSDINPHNGFSEMRSLIEDKNIKVSSLDLSTTSTIPDDAKLIIITGPKGTFQDKEISLLRDFINLEKGRLLVALDPIEEISMIDRPAFGLRGVFKEWGIRCHDMLIHDPDQNNFDIFTGDYSLKTYAKDQSHKITDKLKEGRFSILSTRMRPVELASNDNINFITQEVLYSSKSSWALSSWTNRKSPPIKNDILDMEGPVPVVATSEYKNNHNEYSSRGKLVVVGSSKIFTNRRLKENSGNRILCKNIFNWMLDETNLLDIKPQKLNLYSLNMNENEFTKLLYSLGIIPLCIAILGAFVSWLRKEL
ncbi:MAG: hypothetical protein HN548_05950 [Opitutae bacterium]|nr:hypothetical protein [Opitutae bacterium]